MASCLKVYPPGLTLFARAVAYTIANSPQSQPPACSCTFIIFSMSFFSLEHAIAAICFFVHAPTEGYILSNRRPGSSLHSLLLAQLLMMVVSCRFCAPMFTFHFVCLHETDFVCGKTVQSTL